MKYQEVLGLIKRAYGEMQLAQPAANPFPAARKKMNNLQNYANRMRNKARWLDTSPEFDHNHPDHNDVVRAFTDSADAADQARMKAYVDAHNNLALQADRARDFGRGQSWTKHFWPELKKVPRRWQNAIKAGYNAF